MVHKTVLTLTQPSFLSTAHVRLSLLSGRTHLTSVSVAFTLQCPAQLAPLIPIPNSPNTAFIHEQNVSAGRCPRSSSPVGRPFQSLIASCLEIRPMGSALPPPALSPEGGGGCQLASQIDTCSRFGAFWHASWTPHLNHSCKKKCFL